MKAIPVLCLFIAVPMWIWSQQAKSSTGEIRALVAAILIAIGLLSLAYLAVDPAAQ